MLLPLYLHGYIIYVQYINGQVLFPGGGVNSGGFAVDVGLAVAGQCFCSAVC